MKDTSRLRVGSFAMKTFDQPDRGAGYHTAFWSWHAQRKKGTPPRQFFGYASRQAKARIVSLHCQAGLSEGVGEGPMKLLSAHALAAIVAVGTIAGSAPSAAQEPM